MGDRDSAYLFWARWRFYWGISTRHTVAHYKYSSGIMKVSSQELALEPPTFEYCSPVDPEKEYNYARETARNSAEYRCYQMPQ
jgi:hypothetical protein